MHDFPSTDQLVHQRQRLGELLLSWQAIDETRLASALEIQRRERRPLGAILMEQGWLDEATLREAISFQQGEPTDPPAHPGLAATGNPSTPRAGI
ncbi:hypothetical protein J2W86_001382 [Delftia lacustris]|nr:hypothetical protein [Delftia lacustris]